MSITASMSCCTNRSVENRSACARQAAGDGGSSSTRRIPAAQASTPSPVNTPVPPSTTVSVAPPRPSATTGVPQAWASTGTRPKSSSPGSSTTDARRYISRTSASGSAPRNFTPDPPRRASAGASGPWPDHFQRDTDGTACGHGHIYALVRHQGRDHECERLPRGLARREVTGVHRRVDHGRSPIIVSLDPPRNILRNRHIAVRTVARALVPAGETVEQLPHHRRPGPADPFRPEVGVELVPGVPHRREAVAEVAGAGRGADRLGRAVAGGDHQVGVADVEPFDGERVERQQMAVQARDAGHPLQERRLDRMALDGRRDACRARAAACAATRSGTSRTAPRGPARRRACR